MVGCCVIPCRRSHRNSRPNRPLYFLFFRPSIRHPNDGQTSSPMRSARSNRLSKAPPPPTPSFGWLSRFIFKWRPPKTGAPPISQFVDGRHFGAPNKGTKRRAREPGRRAPLLGSWGGAAPRFGSMADVAMERESKAAGGRAVQRLLILWCVRWDFGGIFRASAPLGTQQFQQKIPSPKKGIVACPEVKRVLTPLSRESQAK